MALLELMFGSKCNHDWEVKSERYIPSTVEKAMENGYDASGITRGAATSKYVVIMACTRCGETDKTVTTNT